MNTRSSTLNDTPADNAHVAALAKAMAGHPVVGVEIAALRKQIGTAERKAAALQGVIDDYAATLGKSARATADAAAGLTDAEALAKFAAMPPAEQAALMLKAAPARRFTMNSAALADGGMPR